MHIYLFNQVGTYVTIFILSRYRLVFNILENSTFNLFIHKYCDNLGRTKNKADVAPKCVLQDDASGRAVGNVRIKHSFYCADYKPSTYIMSA